MDDPERSRIRRHAARGGAAGWAAGSLVGLAWALGESGLTPLAVTGWALGASAGSLAGALAGVELSRELVVLRMKELPRHQRA